MLVDPVSERFFGITLPLVLFGIFCFAFCFGGGFFAGTSFAFLSDGGYEFRLLLDPSLTGALGRTESSIGRLPFSGRIRLGGTVSGLDVEEELDLGGATSLPP